MSEEFRITDVEALERLYSAKVSEASLAKVARAMTPLYAKWIEASKFCILSSVGPEGTDGSPRGDEGPVVKILDANHLALPDWRGNNRLDSLRNIVADGRVSLMFLVPGSNNVVRVNGAAHLTVDRDLLSRFQRGSATPKSVIVIKIREIYTQCARALLRANLWSGDAAPEELPSVGDILKEMTEGRFDGQTYDEEWGARAAKTMW